MDFADIVGWAGNFGFLLGAYWLAKRRPIACSVGNLFGNICYVINGWYYENAPIVFLSITLMIVNIWAVFTWKERK